MRRTVGWVVPLLLCTAAVAFAAGAMGVRRASAPKVVRAERFELVDAEGRVYARLANTHGQTKLELLDGKGTARAQLTAEGPEGAMLGLCDEAGKARAGFLVPSTGPVFMLLDQHERPRLALKATPGDVTGISILDGSRQERAMLGLMERSTELRKRGAMVSVRAPSGKSEIAGLAGDDGQCALALRQQGTVLWRATESQE